MLRNFCIALVACATGGVAAQSAAPPDPADPKASVRERAYESAFKAYRPYTEPEVARWRQSNEEMGRLGGHMGHLRRETGVADRPAAKPTSPATHGDRK